MGRVVDAFLATLPPELRQVDRRIHPRDSMLAFHLSQARGYRDLALLDYFRSGYLAFRVTRQILRWRYGPRGFGERRLLDFGSGCGRVTRFHVRELSPGSLWCAEIDPAAARFQELQFGVHGVASTPEPETFVGDTSFHCILAYSVLSHLPEASFRGWLARWLDLLEDGGLLVFSVHDEALLPPQEPMPDSGFRFQSMSESDLLAPDDYGTAWVTESYVARTLPRLGHPVRYLRLPRGLWHLQDLYVVVKGEEADLSGLDFDPGPNGCLDALRLAPKTGRLELAGWAVDSEAGGQGVEVEVAVDGEPVLRCRPSEERPDVLEALGHAELSTPAGWHASYRAHGRPVRRDDLVVVRAVTPRGSDYVLHVGSVQGTAHYLKLRNAIHRLQEAKRQGHRPPLLTRLRARWLQARGRLGIWR